MAAAFSSGAFQTEAFSVLAFAFDQVPLDLVEAPAAGVGGGGELPRTRFRPGSVRVVLDELGEPAVAGRNARKRRAKEGSAAASLTPEQRESIRKHNEVALSVILQFLED